MITVAPKNYRRPSTLTRFRTDPVGFLRDATESDSPTAEFNIGSKKLTLLKDADQIEEVLVKKQERFRKGPGMLRLRPIIGEGLLTIDNSRHMSARRRIQPAFSMPKIAEYGKDIPSIIGDVIGSWQPGQTLELQSEMSKLTLRIIAATVFASSSMPDHTAVSSAVAINIDALFRPLSRCPHHAAKKTASIETLSTVIESINEGHVPATDGSDLLSLLSDGGFSESEKRDESITFLLGGHESASIALTWTWYALSQNPDVRTAFEKEIDQLTDSEIDIKKLPITRQIVAESLRLYPPAWMFSREAIEDVRIGEVDYPTGSILVVAPIVTHRDSRYWDDPEEFRISRWDSSQFTLSASPKFSYFPFGGGARRCIGEQFALTELPLALAAIGRRWRLDPMPGMEHPNFDPVVTLRPAGGLPMTITAR